MKLKLIIVTLLSAWLSFLNSTAQTNFYRCTPCDLSCDNLFFNRAGDCPHCGMKLLTKEAFFEFNNLIVNDIKIKNRTGVFLIDGGPGNKEKLIEVYYHKPKNFTPDSQILMVIPGSGRDADEYRDSWIESAEKYNVLVLSPRYSEKEYDFGGYHFGGLLYEMNLDACATYKKNSNIVELNEDAFKYKINENPCEWIFKDFDRLFDAVVAKLGSTRQKYDIFGHSAGGQILHRLVLFHPNSKADRILASNSGFYTLPHLDTDLPFGLKNAPDKPINLKQSLKSKLVLFLGELDNENETGGIALHSPTANQQGLHRLARGRYFFKAGEQIAKEANMEFNWKLVTIPGVGHDFRKMGQAAAEYLYE